MSKRRVLVLGLNYSPERTGIAPYTAGMAAGLAEDFEVDVLTVHPHYPEWQVAEGYGGWRRREVVDGVGVTRVSHYVPSDPTGPSRVISEASYAARILVSGLRRPDAIVAVTPALLPVASALMLGKRWRAPVGVIVQDLYSKAFIELGVLGGRLDSSAHRLERGLLLRADGVVSIHDRMAAVITRDYGVPRERITVIPNWTHVQPPSGDREARRKQLGWDDGRTTIVHAGNMGAKQGLEHLVPAARLAKARGLPLRFVLIGNGGARRSLEHLAGDLRTIEFMDAVPGDTFMDTLAAADLLLLHERPGMKEMCVPSKLTSYFAASRPVLAATDDGSAAAFEVRQSGAGRVVEPADPAALLDAAVGLAAGDTEALGGRGLDYALRSLGEGAALAAYRDWVHELMGKA